MRTHVLTLLILLTALSCSSDEVKKHAINANTSEKMEQEHDSLKYLALGDSYTIGESVEVHPSLSCSDSRFAEKTGIPRESTRDHSSYRLDNIRS